MRNCAVFILCLISCMSVAQNTCTISGRIEGLGTGKKVYLANRGFGIGPAFAENKFDSVLSINDSFRFEPFSFRFIERRSIDFETVDGWITFLIDSGMIYIKARADSLFATKRVYGSTNNDIFLKYQKEFYKPWTDSLKNFNTQYNLYKKNGDSAKATQYIDSALTSYKKAAILFFRNNVKASAFAAFAALSSRRYVENFPDSELKKYFLILPLSVQENPHWDNLKYKILGDFEKNISIGAKLPNFSFTDSMGKKQYLYNIRSKYKLLDFWASWCKPCIALVPAIDSAVNLYKLQGLQLVSINLDNKLGTFQKNFGKYNIDCIKLYSESPGTSPIYKYFAHYSIPFMVLLDENNRLVKYNIHLDELARFIK